MPDSRPRRTPIGFVLLLLTSFSSCVSTDSDLLAAAVSNNNVDQAAAFFRRGTVAPARTVSGDLLLNLALERRFERMARLLLVQGVDPNTPDRHERPALYALSPRVNLESSPGGDLGLLVLLAYELTVRQGCVAELSPETVELVLKKVSAIDTLFPDGHGKPTTALMQAAACGHVSTMRALLDHGADPRAATRAGATAVAHASATSRPAAVALLLERGASADVADAQGVTPLMLAATGNSADHLRVLELILAQGVAVNAQDSHGESALSVAVRASTESPSAVRMLVASGADPDLTNRRGETARKLAGRHASEYFGSRSAPH